MKFLTVDPRELYSYVDGLVQSSAFGACLLNGFGCNDLVEFRINQRAFNAGLELES